MKIIGEERRFFKIGTHQTFEILCLGVKKSKFPETNQHQAKKIGKNLDIILEITGELLLHP